MRVIFLRYISRNLPLVHDAVGTCSYLRAAAHFICVLAANFDYFLTERTHI
jgi:hypothetical protein